MSKTIHTEEAPSAIGPYSQAIQVANVVYFSGQIALDPKTMTLVSDDIHAQALQVFNNLKAVATAAQGDLSKIVKLTIYLIDFKDFAIVNEVMQDFFVAPYPARTTIQVAGLPKSAQLEVDAIMVL